MEFDINHTTDLKVLDDVLAKLETEEKSTNEEIIELTSRKRELDEQMNELESMLPNLDLLMSDSKNLSTMIFFASELAEGVSGKVRQLDLAKGRVYSCVQRVEDILDLKACTDGVQKALHDEDFEKAAGHVHRFLSMDETVLRMTSDASEGSTLESSFKLLHTSEEKLKTIVHRQFDAAVHTNDLASIERFFKIFPLIGLHDQGLEKFGKYLCSAISEKCDGHLKLADISDPQRHGVKFADLMTVLFETIAATVEAYQVQVETYYGHGHLFPLLRIVQAECDRQSRRVLDKFRVARNYESVVRGVHRCMGEKGRSAAGQDRPGPKELDPLISEIVLLNTRTELYMRFVKRRATNDMNLASFDAARKTESLKEICRFFDTCALSRQMQELIGNYIMLEEYFMREMVVKAIAMDCLEESSQTSSMVDDVFFIVKKCVRRGLSSSSVDGVCAMLNHACSVLDEQFRNVLSARIKAGFPSGWVQDAYSYVQSSTGAGGAGPGAGPAAGAAQAARQNFLITLNNVETSKECIRTLRESLEGEIGALYAQIASPEQAKLQTCLAELTSVANRFKELLDSGFEHLNSSVVKPQVKTFLQTFESMKHSLTEEDLVNFEANDPWVESYIVNASALLSQFQQTFSSVNYDQFIQLLTNETVSRMEKLILRTQFNRLGGLQLDRDIRSMTSYLTSTTTWSVRDKFTRLNQICSLLNLEKVCEVMDYWKSMTWRLTPKEIRQFLNCRKDFPADDIRRLKL